MTSSPHGLHAPGYTRDQYGWYKGSQNCEVELIPVENQSQFGLQSATRLHELELRAIADQHAAVSNVPGPCRHRPSHHESRLY